MIVDMKRRQDDKSDIILCSAIVYLCITISVLAFSVGKNIGRADAFDEMKKRIEVIETLHKQDSVIQKLRKEVRNEP